MNELEFLSHHGLNRNPFADEDAQTDIVFKEHCIASSFHPSWSKVLGDAREPATAIVFGSKGSGKTAMRLQLASEYRKFNAKNPDQRLFVIHYDDFNAYLGPFEQHLTRINRGKPDRVLQAVRLWDHMDAILCEGVTQLVNGSIAQHLAPTDQGVSKDKIAKLDHGQQRDFLLLAACYDQSKVGTFLDRWKKLRATLGFSNWSTWYDFGAGIGISLLALILWIALFRADQISLRSLFWASLISFIIAWGPYLWRWGRCYVRAVKIANRMRVGRRDTLSMTRVLLSIPFKDLAAQPLPTASRTDDRYALLEKFQMLIRSLGFHGTIVLVDRVDEPDLVNGLPERMKQLIWPMLDNKLLKHPGVGFKLLLPSELLYFVDREDREFNERARLDKQNVIRSFDWTGEALYDLVEARMKACATDQRNSSPTELFDASVTESRLIDAMKTLRTPRSLFRFLYRLLAEHCKTHRSSDPQFKISAATFQSTFAVYQSEQARMMEP